MVGFEEGGELFCVGRPQGLSTPRLMVLRNLSNLSGGALEEVGHVNGMVPAWPRTWDHHSG